MRAFGESCVPHLFPFLSCCGEVVCFTSHWPSSAPSLSVSLGGPATCLAHSEKRWFLPLQRVHRQTPSKAVTATTVPWAQLASCLAPSLAPPWQPLLLETFQTVPLPLTVTASRTPPAHGAQVSASLGVSTFSSKSFLAPLPFRANYYSQEGPFSYSFCILLLFFLILVFCQAKPLYSLNCLHLNALLLKTKGLKTKKNVVPDIHIGLLTECS